MATSFILFGFQALFRTTANSQDQNFFRTKKAALKFGYNFADSNFFRFCSKNFISDATFKLSAKIKFNGTYTNRFKPVLIS